MMTMGGPYRSVAAALVALVLTLACSPAEGPASDAERALPPPASSRLAVDSTLAVRPTAFAADSTLVVLLDGRRGAVLAIDRRTGAVASIGTAGGGPGEFRVPSAVAISDSMIAVADAGLGKLALYRRADLRLYAEVPLPYLVTSMVSSADTLWGAVLSMTDSLAVFRVVAGDSMITPLAPLPADVAANPTVAALFPFGVVAVAGDCVWFGFTASDRVVPQCGGSPSPEGIRVPVRVRRGVPSDLAKRIEVTEDPFARPYLASHLVAMRVLAPDRLAFVHMDWRPSADGGPPRGRAFVSVIGTDGRGACTDLAIPTTEVRPVLALGDEGLYEIVETGETAADGAEVLVLRTFDLSGC